jgi:hypothetical protein
VKMGFDSGRGKQLFAYISSGRVKDLQQFCIIASFATDLDIGVSLKQRTDGAANGCRIVSD